MYGWVNDCVEKFIVFRYGSEFWFLVKGQCGFDHAGQWSHKCSYADESTYALIEAAAKLAQVAVPEVCAGTPKLTHVSNGVVAADV